MSAYVVSREHIAYMVSAALQTEYGVSWKTAGGEWVKLDARSNTCVAVEVGRMLWEENIKSVLNLYQGDTRETMPGPIGENFIFTEKDIMAAPTRIDWVQLLKSIRCYEYQSCEHPSWEKSEAYAFIQSLKECAITQLPGYEEAEWGAPKMEHKSRRKLQS